MGSGEEKHFAGLYSISCHLVPPCRRGNHHHSPRLEVSASTQPDSAIDGSAQETVHLLNPISRYYWDEGSLIHDLRSLRRGEVYTHDDFNIRVRAWYKAEVSRLDHWLQARRVWVWPAERRPSCYQKWESRWREEEEDEEAMAREGRALLPPARRPTRSQPARAAKMKKVATPIKRPSRVVRPGRAKGESRGHYVLAEEHWFEHLRAASRESGVHPATAAAGTPTDLLLFEQAVRSAVQEKLKALEGARTLHQCALESDCESAAFTPRAIPTHADSPMCTWTDESEDDEEVSSQDPVEEAYMVTSPSLGRWPDRSLETPSPEKLGANIVHVAGLTFALDVCDVYTVDITKHMENVRYVMM